MRYKTIVKWFCKRCSLLNDEYLGVKNKHGTKINVGVVAPVTSKSGSFFPGGADQILMPFDWPKEWVIGYRRVSTRQLQKVPTYTEGIPEDRIIFIEDLYKSRTCPMCGSTNNIIVYHGKDADYGPVVCEDDSTCIARYHCLNVSVK